MPPAALRYVAAFAIALLCVAFLGCDARLFPGGEAPEETRATVVRVADGDTIEVSPQVAGTGEVRLIGVDAPERFGPRGGQPYAEEATDFAERTLGGRTVALEFDAELRDDYGRILAYVRVDGSMLNERLLEKGLAQVATFPPNTRYLDRFHAAQRKAREAERGLWGLPQGELCGLANRGNGIGGGC